jgi:glycosyltransferase involved in cell wall biosynthesis
VALAYFHRVIAVRESVEDALLPGISVVTPTLNAARYLPDCLHSVRVQGVPNLEHLVVDGGSSDDTARIVQAAQGVTWLERPGSNQSQAINAGFRATDGDVLAWLNADDTYAPGALAFALERFGHDDTLDGLYGDCDVVDAGDRHLWRIEPGAYSFRRLLRRGNYLAQPAVFLRRRVLERVGYLDESLEFGMDYDLWLRLRGLRVAYVHRTLATFRWHAESKSASGQLGAWNEIPTIVRRYGGGWTPELGWAFFRCLVTLAKSRLVGRSAVTMGPTAR